LGAPLFDQDDAMDRAAVDQAAHLTQQARDQLANLQGPAKPTEIAQAEANLNDAIAARGKVQADLQRNETLLASGSATKQIVDQERADLASAEAKIAAAAAAVKQAQAPLGRPDEIVAQASSVEAADAALAQARWRLGQRSVASPVAGLVADVLARPGETLQAGAPVVSLLPPENIFIRFFVPEPSLAHVHIGDTVALTCDNCRPDLTGAVSFVAPQAEYTPPFIYSESTRAKFVFLAEARPKADEAALFNPGQPVTVKPRAAPP
jgi:HlyD family secretion protein